MNVPVQSTLVLGEKDKTCPVVVLVDRLVSATPEDDQYARLRASGFTPEVARTAVPSPRPRGLAKAGSRQ